MNSQSNSLRYCRYCHKPEGRDRKLKRCAACLVALYCSPECQRAAWPEHKQFCEGPGKKPPNSDANVLRYGYSSVTSCQQDLQDFIRAHIWALRLNAKARCHRFLDAQVDEIVMVPPRLLTVRLSCRSTPNNHERNPASKFTIVEQTFGDLEWYIRTFPDSWESAAPSRAELLRTWTRHSQFMGILSILYFLPNTHVSSLDFHPIYRLGRCTTSSPEWKQQLLEDMLDFCSASVNSGFPLRSLDLVSSAPVALPGRYVKQLGKVWQWRPLFGDWKDYVPGDHDSLDSAVSAATAGSGLSVPDLMRAILNL